ncbi:MAG: organic solvent tolerance protein [Bdellovibrionales bacterium]
MRRLLALLAFVTVSGPAFGKDLANRLGVGYTDQFGITEGLPSLAVRYYPSTDMAVGASLGVDTAKDEAKFGFSARIMRTIFQEDNMNFYLGASGGLISREKRDAVTDAVNNDSGFDLAGFGGLEFFLPGLDSLGFNVEMGVGVTSISSEVRFRTIGDSPLRAGATFYF